MRVVRDAGPLRSEWRRGKPLPGNRVDLLQGGAAFFPALIDAIDGAQHRVALETYIYTDDATALAALAPNRGQHAVPALRLRSRARCRTRARLRCRADFSRRNEASFWKKPG